MSYIGAEPDGNAVADATSLVYMGIDYDTHGLIHRVPFSVLVTSGTTDPYQKLKRTIQNPLKKT